MKTVGIIVEYNPLHSGHLFLMEEVRRTLGADTRIICVMSGDFVQRGDFALVRRQARARAAVESGADLVLELPLPWAVSSADGFADGGVQTLLATGLVQHLAFGSECGDIAALQAVARTLLQPEFSAALQEPLRSGISFAAARQQAIAQLLDEPAARLLAQPNNILAVEYCKSLLRHNASALPLTVQRTGTPHDAGILTDGHPSASAIRSLLSQGQRDNALARMAPAMARAYLEEESLGRAPVMLEGAQRAMLAQLRRMTPEEFDTLDAGGEGLSRRLYEASRSAASLEELWAAAKTKRYAHARLRRMTLWAYLGLRADSCPPSPAYLRPLAANAVGCGMLSEMRTAASLPILTKPADVRQLSSQAQALFALESRAADLYTLAYPNLSAAEGGVLWRSSPAIL